MKIKRIFKYTLFFLIAAFIAISELYSDHHIKLSDAIYYLTRYESDLARYEKDFGLVFRPYLDKARISSDFYQDKWSRVDVDPTVNEPVELARFVRALRPELAKIPPAVLKKDLDTIYFLTVIFNTTVPAGGSYHVPDNAVFIRSNPGSELKYPVDFFQYALHHEFSSILMKKYHFDKVKWREAYPDEFVYGGEKYFGYYHMMLTGDVPVMTEQELHDRALLNQYSETSVENDFNTYAEYVFTRPEELKQLIAEYPIIKRKYEVFKEFYLGIDKGFQPVFDKIDG